MSLAACVPDAERALLGAILLAGGLAGAERLRPVDFQNRSVATIFGAMQRLSGREVDLDLVAIFAELRANGELGRLGGEAVVLELLGEYPSGSVAGYAELICRAAFRRQVSEAGSRFAAEVATCEDPVGLARSLGADLRRVEGSYAIPSDSFAAVTPIGDREWLTSTPPARKLLLTRDGVPFLPASSTGSVVADGGVGKTFSMLALALSLATGRPWLGVFEVVDPGRVVVLLGEEDDDEVHRRLHAIASMRGLTREEIALGHANIVAAGLAGERLELTRASGREYEATDVFDRLAELVERYEPSLLLLDPLSRWGGPDTELSVPAATFLVQCLERLTRLRGRPSVIVAHHTAKAARGAKKGRTEDARGVTATSDGLRWSVRLTEHEKDGLVELSLTKRNNMPPHPVVRLERAPESGALRSAASASSSKASPSRAPTASHATDILAAVGDHDGISKNALLALLKERGQGFNRQSCLRAVDQLVADGRLRLDRQKLRLG